MTSVQAVIKYFESVLLLKQLDCLKFFDIDPDLTSFHVAEF
jgi:hypothetical protein